jgi:hypothetical protein
MKAGAAMALLFLFNQPSSPFRDTIVKNNDF